MKYKVSELSGIKLDWLVTILEHPSVLKPSFLNRYKYKSSIFHYSTSWGRGRQIIKRKRISLSSTPYSEGEWCYAKVIGSTREYNGPTPLIAAMRCYVASKLGDEIEIPDEIKE